MCVCACVLATNAQVYGFGVCVRVCVRACVLATTAQVYGFGVCVCVLVAECMMWLCTSLRCVSVFSVVC